MAIGDGANDLPMIEAAGLGVAYHGKPIVAQAARARIDHGDLTALLYAQGYRRERIRRAEMKRAARGRPFVVHVDRRQLIGSATNSMSPAGVATSSSAVFLPAFFSASTRAADVGGVADLLLLDRHQHAAGNEPLVGGDRGRIDRR